MTPRARRHRAPPTSLDVPNPCHSLCEIIEDVIVVPSTPSSSAALLHGCYNDVPPKVGDFVDDVAVNDVLVDRTVIDHATQIDRQSVASLGLSEAFTF